VSVATPFQKLGYAGLIALFLLVPATARAKGPGLDHAELDGPGISDPIRLEHRYPYLLDDAVFMTVFGSGHDPDVGRPRSERGSLGVRYQLSFNMTFGEPVLVDLYPYAEEGPVAYATPGQTVAVPIGDSGRDHEFEVQAGWYDYRPALVELLQEQGLPPETEARAERCLEVA
jgi:hypothetical protein